MPESRTLVKRQRAVLDDLFTDKEGDEQTVLKNHGVGRSLYEKWLTDERFSSQIEQRIANAYRQSRVILARNAPEAAKKLVELTKKGEGETARKACLDIISRQHPADCKAPSNAPPTPEAANLSPETASRLLAVLAGQT